MTTAQNDYVTPVPGRIRMSLSEAKNKWVTQMPESQHRLHLWGQFETYLARFAKIEEHAISEGWIEPTESLITYLWLGGSFISDKPEPGNLDFTLFLNHSTLQKIKGKPGTGWIGQEAFSRKKLRSSTEFSKITPLRVDYYPVKSVFKLGDLTQAELSYLTNRGAWDDWWQRKRNSDDRAPSRSSAGSRRGYVEVIL